LRQKTDRKMHFINIRFPGITYLFKIIPLFFHDIPEYSRHKWLFLPYL
jgi:hypothetical protein